MPAKIIDNVIKINVNSTITFSAHQLANLLFLSLKFWKQYEVLKQQQQSAIMLGIKLTNSTDKTIA